MYDYEMIIASTRNSLFNWMILINMCYPLDRIASTGSSFEAV